MEELFATTRAKSGNGGAHARRAVLVCSCAVLLCFLSSPHTPAQPAGAAQVTTTAPSPSPTPDPLNISLQSEKLSLENKKLSLENRKLELENEYNKRELSWRGLGYWLYVNVPGSSLSR